MKYENFIEYILIGHEFIGFVCSEELKILNLDDDYITVIINNKRYDYPYDKIENVKIYNNKTFKEIYNEIKIEEIY